MKTVYFYLKHISLFLIQLIIFLNINDRKNIKKNQKYYRLIKIMIIPLIK